MVWDAVSARWEKAYAEAAVYYAENGDLETPTKYVTPSGVALAAGFPANGDFTRTESYLRTKLLDLKKSVWIGATATTAAGKNITPLPAVLPVPCQFGHPGGLCDGRRHNTGQVACPSAAHLRKVRHNHKGTIRYAQSYAGPLGHEMAGTAAKSKDGVSRCEAAAQ